MTVMVRTAADAAAMAPAIRNVIAGIAISDGHISCRRAGILIVGREV
jgi:hypothetical protein